MTATIEASGLALQERARLAIAARDAAKAKKDAAYWTEVKTKAERELRADLEEKFGISEIPPSAVTLSDGQRMPYVLISVDGLLFAHTDTEDADWQTLAIARKCEGCGGAVYHQSRSIEELGDALAKRPIHWSCKTEERERAEKDGDVTPSLNDKLAEVIREVVREEMGNQGVGL